jgi:hypothetical protein
MQGAAPLFSFPLCYQCAERRRRAVSTLSLANLFRVLIDGLTALRGVSKGRFPPDGGRPVIARAPCARGFIGLLLTSGPGRRHPVKPRAVRAPGSGGLRA